MTFDRKGAFQGTEGGVDMPMTINQFRQLAAYNRWANARLGKFASIQPPEQQTNTTSRGADRIK